MKKYLMYFVLAIITVGFVACEQEEVLEKTAQDAMLESRNSCLESCYATFVDNMPPNTVHQYKTYLELDEVPALKTLQLLWNSTGNNMAYCEYINCIGECTYGMSFGDCDSLLDDDNDDDNGDHPFIGIGVEGN